jgi:hypothetical protein
MILSCFLEKVRVLPADARFLEVIIPTSAILKAFDYVLRLSYGVYMSLIYGRMAHRSI